MKSKTDKSLLEVWEMKERVYSDFKKSKFKSYIDFIENDIKDIKSKYNIKYRTETLENH